MIGSTAGVQIWVATAPVDMRQGFDRLAARVREHLSHNPLGGGVALASCQCPP